MISYVVSNGFSNLTSLDFVGFDSLKYCDLGGLLEFVVDNKNMVLMASLGGSYLGGYLTLSYIS